MTFPPSSAPARERLRAALIVVLLFPLWWPAMWILLLLLWAFSGALFIALGFACLGFPLIVLRGIDPVDHAELEVRVPADREKEAVRFLRDLGASVRKT